MCRSLLYLSLSLFAGLHLFFLLLLLRLTLLHCYVKEYLVLSTPSTDFSSSLWSYLFSPRVDHILFWSKTIGQTQHLTAPLPLNLVLSWTHIVFHNNPNIYPEKLSVSLDNKILQVVAFSSSLHHESNNKRVDK